MKNKKSSITITLSWVFVIIVGVFFLILSYNIINNYRENKDIEYQIELKQTLRSVFNKFARTSGSEENSLAPLGDIFKNSEVDIICNNGLLLLSINDEIDPNNNYLKNYPVFMTYINQKSISNTYLAVENFKMPFKITNMLAIVSKKNLIVFDKNSEISNELYTKFRQSGYSELNYLYLDFKTGLSNFENLYVEDKNINSVIFVTGKSNTINDIDLNNFKTKAYILRFDKKDENYGNLIYKDKNNKEYNYTYYDYDNNLALPVMAVFSDPYTFNCSYNVLLKSIEQSYSFYELKSKIFEQKNEKICINSINIWEQGSYYEDIKENLHSIKSEIKNNKFKNIENVKLNITLLDEQNLGLGDLSCPLIY